MRAHEGPTKNPIQRRQRNAQQKRRHNAPAGISNSESKEYLQTWSVFVCFWLKYGWNELGTEFRLVRNHIPKDNLHPAWEKSNGVSTFFSKNLTLREKDGRFTSSLRWGPACAGLGSLAHARRQVHFPARRDQQLLATARRASNKNATTFNIVATEKGRRRFAGGPYTRA